MFQLCASVTHKPKQKWIFFRIVIIPRSASWTCSVYTAYTNEMMNIIWSQSLASDSKRKYFADTNVIACSSSILVEKGGWTFVFNDFFRLWFLIERVIEAEKHGQIMRNAKNKDSQVKLGNTTQRLTTVYNTFICCSRNEL